MLVALALSSTSAHALQRPRSGPLVEVGVGGGAARGRGELMVQPTLAWWFGRYDDDYALGRFTAIGVTPRIGIGKDGPSLSPMLEVRRSMDLFVLAPHYLITAGPTFGPTGMGVSARVGGGLKFRRSKTLGFTGRLVAGVDVIDGDVFPAVGLTVGLGWSVPAR